MRGRAAHERPTDASSRDSGRAPGRFRRDRARGRDSAIACPYSCCVHCPSASRRARSAIRALVPRLAPPRVLCPVEHETRGDERSRSAPHDLVGLVVDVRPDARVELVGEMPGSVRARNAQAEGPDLPDRSADSRSARASPSTARGRASPRAARACASATAARFEPSLRGRGRRRSSSAHRTPAAPQYSVLQRARRRQRSQSSAGQRSFGPRNAASVSSTISRMPARIRSSSQGSSVSGSKSSGR